MTWYLCKSVVLFESVNSRDANAMDFETKVNQEVSAVVAAGIAHLTVDVICDSSDKSCTEPDMAYDAVFEELKKLSGKEIKWDNKGSWARGFGGLHEEQRTLSIKNDFTGSWIPWRIDVKGKEENSTVRFEAILRVQTKEIT